MERPITAPPGNSPADGAVKSLVSAEYTNPVSPMVDARPIIPRTREGLLYKVEEIRDSINVLFWEELKRRGLQGNVLRSHPLVHPAWVSIEIWEPKKDNCLLTKRSSAVVNITAFPYHQYEILYDIKLDYRGREINYKSITRFSSREASKIVAYLLGETEKPNFHDIRLRRWPVELWKPGNKPSSLTRDWIGMIPAGLCLIGLLLWGTGLFFWGLLFFAAAGTTAWFLKRRPIEVHTSGKPIGEPRHLVIVDSWQTVVFGLGTDLETVRGRFLKRLERPLSDRMRWQSENIWYWGLDGTIEREQLVLTLGRSMLFVHLNKYEDDLYIGWDAHLNKGQWVEKDLFQGIDKQTKCRTNIKVVESGVQPLCEYDLTDANTLLEWTHAQIVQVSRQIMLERKIEQEIDFSIIRGERQQLAQGRARESTAISSGSSQMANRVRSLLKRTG